MYHTLQRVLRSRALMLSVLVNFCRVHTLIFMRQKNRENILVLYIARSLKDNLQIFRSEAT